MKEVEKTNVVIVCMNQQARFAPCNPYAMDIGRGNRNCYNYGGFEYLARNCMNRGIRDIIRKERRLEYGNESNEQRRMIEEDNKQNNNLNGDENLIILD